MIFKNEQIKCASVAFKIGKSTDLDSVITGDKWASRTSRKTIHLDSFVETNTMRDSK